MSFYKATCIGCNCDDHNACIVATPAGLRACHWVRIDRASGVGVCSAPGCAPFVAQWDRATMPAPPPLSRYGRKAAAANLTGSRS